MTEQEYINYFEFLAGRHAAIQHKPEQEDAQAFFVVHDDNFSEVEQAVKNELSLPALLLDQYYDDLDLDSDNNRLRIEGGLSVVCRFESGNKASIRAARFEARRIARSLLNRLKKDCRPGGLLIDSGLFPGLIVPTAADTNWKRQALISLSTSAQGQPTPVIGGNAAGWGYSFTLLMPTQVALEQGDWLDNQ